MSLFSGRSEASMADSWPSVKEMTPHEVGQAKEDVYVVEAEDEEQNGRIGKGSLVVGTLQFEGSVRVYGDVEGEIVAAGAVIVRRGGRVNGQVRASRVVIEGEVTADVRSNDRVEIGATGRLFGSVIAPRLVIHEGAIFEGRCAMTEGAHPAEVSPPRAAEPLPLAS